MTNANKRSRNQVPPADRLWSATRLTENGCLVYVRYCHPTHGYGQISNGAGGIIETHRAAWILTYGPIPGDLWVLHSCDNPPCCNPEHLFLGTVQDNVDDMHRKGRARKAQGMRNGRARLTAAQVESIRKRWVPGGQHGHGVSSGNTLELAREYGITKQYVGQLCRGLWRKNA